MERSTIDLIRRLNEISERECEVGQGLEFRYHDALATSAGAFRDCLSVDTFRGRLVQLALAERQFGIAIALSAGNPPSETHKFLINAAAMVLSLIANGPQATRKITRIG